MSEDGLAEMLNGLKDGGKLELKGSLSLKHPLGDPGKDFKDVDLAGQMALSRRGNEVYVLSSDGKYLASFRPQEEWHGHDGRANATVGTYMSFALGPTGWRLHEAQATIRGRLLE